MLEVHKAQYGRDRDRGAAQPGGEVPAPGGEEALVVEVGVDAASSSGRRVAWSGSRSSQAFSGGVVVRSSVISYNSDNGVIRP